VWWKRKIQIIKLPNSATINVNTDFDRPEEAINVGIEKGNTGRAQQNRSITNIISFLASLPVD